VTTKTILLLTLFAACTSKISREDAALEISEHACDRAATCGNLGGQSVSDCASGDFTSLCDQYPGCQGSADTKQLDECLAEIDMLSCTSEYLPVDCFAVLAP
jgi:hypothetical protein